MKYPLRFLFALVFFLGSYASLSALQAWSQPLPIVEYENLVFMGNGCLLADGSYILAWDDRSEIDYTLRIMRYSSSHQELWPQPLSLSVQNRSFLKLHPTHDGGFVLLYVNTDIGWGVYIRKFNADGNPMWNGQANYLNQSYNFRAALTEDSQGGLWVVSTCDAHFVNYRYFDASGVAAVYQGTEIPGSYYGYSLNVILAPSGGVVIGFSQPHAYCIYRVAQDQTIAWEQSGTISNTVHTIQLLQNDESSFYMIAGTSTLYARLYNYSGQMLWPEEVQVCSGVNLQEWKAQRCSNATLRVIWKANHTLHIDRVSPTGVLLEPLPSIDMINNQIDIMGLYSHPGTNDESYICFLLDEHSVMTYYYCRMNNSGFLDTQLQEIGSAPRSHVYPNPWYEIVAGDLQCIYNVLDIDQSRIVRATCDFNGGMEFNVMETSSYGLVEDPAIACAQQQIICAWRELDIISGQTSSYYSHTRIRFQIYSQTGSPQLAQPAIVPASGVYTNLQQLKVMGLPGGEFMLVWIETGSPSRIKAQLISAAGLPLLEPEGRVILEGIVESYYLSVIDDVVYLAFDDGESIILQKIVSGQPMWGTEGILIVYGSDLVYGNKLLYMKGDYIVYGVTSIVGYDLYTCIRVLRFGPEGTPLPGFEPEGISIYPIPNHLRVNCTAHLSPQGMLLRVNHYYEYYGDEGYSLLLGPCFQYLVDLQGQFPWNEGLPDPGYNIYAAEPSGFYAVSNVPTPVSLKKYDYNGQLLWSESCMAAGLSSSTFINEAVQLNNGYWVAIDQVNSNLGHFCFGSEGGIQVPDDSILEDTPLVRGISLAKINDALYVCWRMNPSGVQLSTHVYMQKLNAIPNSSDDPTISSLPFRLLGAHPNPFSEVSNIDIDCMRASQIQIEVYNLKGQKIRVLNDNYVEKGLFTVNWDGKDRHGNPVSSGIYFVQLKTKGTKPICFKLMKMK